jgi:periplasmic protein CpxP/Spy
MKNFMLFSLMMLISVGAFAQKSSKNAAEHIQKKVDHLTQELSLTADQQTKVKELLTAQQANRKPKTNKGEQMTEEQRAAIKEERKAEKAAFDTKMMNILTAEQQATYKNMAREKKQEGKEQKNKGKKGKSDKADHHKGGVAQKVAKMTEDLNLSSEQQKQMTELFNSQKEDRKANGKPMKDMSDEEKEQYKADRKAERAAFDAKVEAILTPEQLVIYQQKKGEYKSDKKEGKGGKEKGKGAKGRTIEE